MKKQLNPTLVYILSVLGFICCCFGGLGFLLSGPAYFIADNKIKGATANPEEYEGNVNAMNTAKIVALVVTIINLLNFLWAIYSVATGGWEDSQRQWQEMLDQINNQ